MAKRSLFTSKVGDTENINNFVPSVLNPRASRRSADNNLSQLSTTSLFSLSLRKKPRQTLHDIGNTQDTAVEPQVPFFYSQRKPASRDNEHGLTEELARRTEKKVTDENSATDKNFDIISISSCTTQLYDPYVHTTSLTLHSDSKTSQESQQYSVGISKMDDHVILSCKFNGAFPKSNKTKRLSTSEDVEIKRKVTESADDSLVVVLSRTAVEEYSRIVVEPPNFKLEKRDSKNNKTNRLKSKTDKFHQPKITPFLCKPKPNFTSRCTSSEDDECVFVSCEDTEGTSRTTSQYLTKPNGLPQITNIVFPKRPDLKESNPNLRESNPDLRESNSDLKESNPYLKESNLDLKESNPYLKESNPDLKESNMDLKESTPDFKKSNPDLKESKPNLKDSKPKPGAENQLDKKITQKRRREIPTYKIIAGTQFAVDAFCYGNIPNVKTYFLTHFHSDHYAGLRKSFNNILYCTKITADLCIWRLGVNSKYIKIINVNETQNIDGVKVTAVDANHCPGSIMLVFSLSSGKNILHCGDFRATPAMESHPVFWNLDIHTVYLDTTYCNPRFSFPTQCESIEMALDILQRKKDELKKMNKPFSEVLIACGTYTIGKENFFLGLSERERCSVWARPEKSAFLHTTLGRRFDQQPPQRCQIHVLDVRELTHHDLKEHLDSMQGAFSEVVAFRPSGWEHGTRPPAQINNVTIHGIPYSEHSSFPEMVRFVKYLRPKLVVPTVPLRDGGKTVQKYFPCPLASKEDVSQKRINDFFNISKRTLVPDVT